MEIGKTRLTRWSIGRITSRLHGHMGNTVTKLRKNWANKNFQGTSCMDEINIDCFKDYSSFKVFAIKNIMIFINEHIQQVLKYSIPGIFINF